MRWSKMLTIVGAHAEGEVGQVITGGVTGVPGATMGDKMRHLDEVDDRLRRFTLCPPRGNAHMSVNLLLPPTRPDADAGFIVMQVSSNVGLQCDVRGDGAARDRHAADAGADHPGRA